MPKDESESILRGLRPEASGPHTNFEAYHTSAKSRLQEVVALPSVGGLKHAVEVLRDPESEVDPEEFLLNLMSISYSKGRDDEHMFVSGQADNDDLRIIGNYQGPPPEEQPSP